MATATSTSSVIPNRKPEIKNQTEPHSERNHGFLKNRTEFRLKMINQFCTPLAVARKPVFPTVKLDKMIYTTFVQVLS